MQVTEKMFVYCKFQIEGIHYWPEATNYLKHPHRHMFHFEVKVQTIEDRQIEFIELGQELLKYMKPPWERTVSCEQLAGNVVDHLKMRHGFDRIYIVDVSEDGENGVLVVYEPASSILGEQLNRYDLSFNVTGVSYPDKKGVDVSLNLEAIARNESIRFGAHSFKLDVTQEQWKALDGALRIAMKEVMDADSSK